MKYKFKATITTEEYAKQNIQKYLNEAVMYKAQVRIITTAIEDPAKKDDAIKALTALEQQLKAGEQALKAWEELYFEEQKSKKK